MPATNNLLKRLFEELIIDKNLNESKLLAILAEELKGTLDIINANLWKINSFKNFEVKKKDNELEYVTLLGCYGYIPDENNTNEFVHDLTTGIFSEIFSAPIENMPYEFSVSNNSKFKKLHIAPSRVVQYNLDRLIVIPLTYKNTAGYDSRYVLNLYVHPYEGNIDLKKLINPIKNFFQFSLQNKKEYAAANLIIITMEHFEKYTERNKDTASNLHLLIDKLNQFIKFDACSIFMWDPTHHQLVFKKSSAKKFDSNQTNSKLNPEKPFYYPGVGKTGIVYQTGKPLIIDNINHSSEKDKYQFREHIAHGLKSFMAIPIIHPSRPSEKLGVIRLVNRLNNFNQNIVDYFSYDDYRLIKDFGALLALHLEIDQNEKIRTAFAKHMEHEIQGPIISTKNEADRLLKKKESEKLEDWQLIQNLKRIIDNATLLNAIIKNVRYTWQGSEGVLRTHIYEVKKSINLQKDILKPARDMVIPLLRTEGYNPESIQIEGGDFELCVDDEAFMQVFINLFSNAIKYRNKNNPSTTLVNVKCENHDKNHSTIIEVIDYGIGIAKENIEHVFRFGYREEDTLATSVRGLGIGLSVVKKIIDDFHSSIHIEPPVNNPRTNPTIFKICLSTKLNVIDYIGEEEWKTKLKNLID